MFLDITASTEQRELILHAAERAAESVFIPLTVGGGVRSVSDVRRLLRAGADKVAVNSAVVRRPELVQEAAAEFGSQAIVVAIDARRTRDAPREGGQGGEEKIGVGGLCRRGPGGDRLGRGLVGTASGRSGRRRDTAHLHGQGRDHRGVRPETHQDGRRIGPPSR